MKSTSRELKWIGPAKVENNQQEMVCTAEQTHSLPWNYTKEEGRELTVYCKILKILASNCDLEIICQYLILLDKKLVNNQATFAVSPRLVNGSEVIVPVKLGRVAHVTVKILANPAPYYFKLTKNDENLQAIEHTVRLTIRDRGSRGRNVKQYCTPCVKRNQLQSYYQKSLW
jgi:hypothetical protein